MTIKLLLYVLQHRNEYNWMLKAKWRAILSRRLFFSTFDKNIILACH